MDQPLKPATGWMRGRPANAPDKPLAVKLDLPSTIAMELNETMELAATPTEEMERDLDGLGKVATEGFSGVAYRGPAPAWKVGLMAVHMAALRLALETEASLRPQAERIFSSTLRKWIFHPEAERFISHLVQEAQTGLANDTTHDAGHRSGPGNDGRDKALTYVHDMTMFYRQWLSAFDEQYG